MGCGASFWPQGPFFLLAGVAAAPVAGPVAVVAMQVREPGQLAVPEGCVGACACALAEGFQGIAAFFAV